MRIEPRNTLNRPFGMGLQAALAAATLVGSVSAATFTIDDGGTTYTIIEADPYADGDTVGNSTAVGGGFFSGTANDGVLWRDRTIDAFFTGYENLVGATNRVYDTGINATEIVTTVSGLAPDTYDVFVVYVYRADGATGAGAKAGGRANLNGAIADTGAVAVNETTVAVADLGGVGATTWNVGLAQIGSTSAGATGFTVNWDEDEAGGVVGRSDYVGIAYTVGVAPTDFISGAMLTPGNWSNGLPVAPIEGTVAADGTYDDDSLGSANWFFTMTGGTITVVEDWNFTGASNVTISGGTLDVAGDILVEDTTVMTIDGGTINWDGKLDTGMSFDSKIVINGGTFDGTGTGTTSFGNSTGSGEIIITGGTISASVFDFSSSSSLASLGGTAMLDGTSGTFGVLDIGTDWSGSFTLSSFSGSDWQNEFVDGYITLDGYVLDAPTFALNFTVTDGGQTLNYAPTTAFTGGELLDGLNWTNGLPTGIGTGTVAEDGTINGSTFGFGPATTVDMTAGTLTSTGTNGFNTVGGGTWNISGGTIVTRYFLVNSDGGNPSVVNLSGGTVQLADVDGTQNLGVAHGAELHISGTAVLDGANATTDVQVDGTIDIASDWTGSWTWGFYSGYDWEDLFLAGSITLNGATQDLAGFEANFEVTNGGQTLAIGSGGTPDQGSATLEIIGVNEFDELVIHASNLNPAKTYDLKRGTDLVTFPDFVDTPITGLTEVDLFDVAPPDGKAFYRLSEQ